MLWLDAAFEHATIRFLAKGPQLVTRLWAAESRTSNLPL